MGCSLCGRKPGVDNVADRIDENRYNHLFYTTKEYDLSKSQNDDNDEGERRHSPSPLVGNSAGEAAKITPTIIEANNSTSLSTNAGKR